MKVTDPLGRTWRVSRRWVPWRRRLKPVGATDTPLSASKADNDFLDLIQWLLYLPMIVVWLARMVELLVLLLLVPATALVRVAFRRPWPVEVRKGFRPWWEGPAHSFSASSEQIRNVAAAIQRGDTPPGRF